MQSDERKKQIKEELEMIKSLSVSIDAMGIIEYAVDRFGPGNIALASSLSAEDQVLTDMISRSGSGAGIFTLDTFLLPPETHYVIEKTRAKYGAKIEVLFPDAKEVLQMINEHGEDQFYKSIELRKECCRVRKVNPLKKRLSSLKAWITGIRRDQSVTREEIMPLEWDDNFDLFKINPLYDWDDQRVWEYIKKNDVPYNSLHDKGYPSIGCAPCTRAVKAGEDIRAGRWWWEKPEHKECGLHPRKQDLR